MIVKLEGYPLNQDIYLDISTIVSMTKDNDFFTINLGDGGNCFQICSQVCSFEQILSLWTKDAVYDMTDDLSESDGCIIICWEVKI